jgi:hypothetical protein
MEQVTQLPVPVEIGETFLIYPGICHAVVTGKIFTNFAHGVLMIQTRVENIWRILGFCFSCFFSVESNQSPK